MSQGTRSFFFGTTLSEIGFILFFALLLFAFFQQEVDKDTIEEEKLIIAGLERELSLKEMVLEKIEHVAQLSREEQDEFFQELIPVANLQAENEVLSQEKEDLRVQLEELSDVQEMLAKLAKENRSAEEEVKEALKVKEALQEALKGDTDSVSPEQMADALQLASALEKYNEDTEEPIESKEALVQRLDDARQFDDMKRSNDNLKGQVINLRGRIGGRDLPPCWAHKDTGKIEYLFNIAILDEGLMLSSAAPDYRLNEYKEIANTSELTSSLLNLSEFRYLATPILQLTDVKGCRHYVAITDKSQNAYKSTLTIEDYFYKFVNRL